MKQKKDFDSWVRWLFDHPVAKRAWYWKSDAIEMILPPATLADYIALLFQNPKQHLDRFSDEQLSQGFWFLVGSMCSDQLRVWFDDKVNWEKRKSGIVATETVFREIFAPRGSSHFTPESDGPKLDIVGYMWWDIVACSNGPNTNCDHIHLACIDTMASILQLNSPVCLYSALHGLGHWQTYDQPRVVKIIDHYLTHANPNDTRLIQYARDAREGNVQ
jgi:hypothetical protein